MGRFAGVKNAEMYGGGKYLPAGTHELEVHEVTCFDSAKTPGREYFCVEADVISTTNEAVSVGERLTWLVNMQLQPAEANILRFALSLAPDTAREDVTEEFLEALVGSAQPARGIRVRALGTNIETSKGNPFTRVDWEAL